MRRVIFYLFYDPQGQVDEFVLHKLRALRPHAEHLFVVSNSPFADGEEDRLLEVADTVWVRDNIGFDVWAYKEAMVAFGQDRLREFDELILMNYTFFGPVGSFAPVFERMDAEASLDFWGLTDHEPTAHPYAPDKPLPRHIQSHWIAVRRDMFTSEAWAGYWRDMPMIESYIDSIVHHEGRLTDHFERLGFLSETAWPASDYPTAHPIAENTVAMLADGCPIVKRRSFFSDPLYLDRRGVDTRQIARAMERSGFPMDLLYANLARTSEPRVLATNLGLLEVIPDCHLGLAPSTLRVTGVGHATDASGLRRVLDAFAALPPASPLIITVPADADIGDTDLTENVEIRRVPEGCGTSSALLVGCRDLIEGDTADVLVRIHADRGSFIDSNVAEQREHQLLRDVAASPDYLRNALSYFERHPSLGMLMPPVVHMGIGTLGRGWARTRPRAEELAATLGIQVPFDATTPLAPYGGMFIARPKALRPLLDAFAGWPTPVTGVRPGGPRDLEGTVERLLGYAALGQGLHVRQLTHPDTAAMSYLTLEYKYDRLTEGLPPRPEAQIARVKAIQD